jgi:hypothetical protein
MAQALAPRVRLGTRLEAHRRTLATGALGAILALGAIVLLYAGRHLTFFYDEWTFIQTRRGGGLHTYLDPHNGHLSLIPVLVYKALFKLVGLRHYTPYRVVGVVVQLICASLLYVLGRRRVGPWLALVPVILLLFMGSAFQDLLWPFQIGYEISIATGLGAFALLEGPVRARDGWVAALLVCSVASSGVGVCFMVACAVMLIAQREPWRRLWVPALPALLYVIWAVGWGSGDTTTSDAVLGAPQYVANAVAGVAAGIAGLDDGTWGPALAVGLVAVVLLAWQFRRGGRVTPLLLAALVGGFSFWVLTALTRASVATPAASRYLYVGAVFVWLVLLEVSAGVRVRPAWLGLGALVVAAAFVSNLGMLRAGERGLRFADATVQASLAAVDVARPVVSPAFVLAPTDAPGLTAGAYLAAARDLGSPAFTFDVLRQQFESIRAQADQTLMHAEELAVVPAPRSATGTGAPSVIGTSGGRVARDGSCERFDPASAGGHIDLATRPGQGVLVHLLARATAVVYLRRFGSGFDAGPLGAIGGRGGLIRFPADDAPGISWGVRVGSGGPISLCGV